MTTNADSAASLRLAVTRLERNNRWLTALTALVGLGLVLSIVLPARTVPSQRFSLLDGGGRQRGMWRVSNETSAVILQDSGGRWRLVADVGTAGPRVQLNGVNGEPLIEFGARDEEALLTMRDEQGRARLEMRVSDGGGRLLFLSRDGDVLSELGENASRGEGR